MLIIETCQDLEITMWKKRDRVDLQWVVNINKSTMKTQVQVHTIQKNPNQNKVSKYIRWEILKEKLCQKANLKNRYQALETIIMDLLSEKVCHLLRSESRLKNFQLWMFQGQVLTIKQTQLEKSKVQTIPIDSVSQKEAKLYKKNKQNYQDPETTITKVHSVNIKVSNLVARGKPS